MHRMIKMLKQVTAGILTGMLLCPVFLLPVNGAESVENFYAQGAVLMDAKTGRVLYGKMRSSIFLWPALQRS